MSIPVVKIIIFYWETSTSLYRDVFIKSNYLLLSDSKVFKFFG